MEILTGICNMATVGLHVIGNGADFEYVEFDDGTKFVQERTCSVESIEYDESMETHRARLSCECLVNSGWALSWRYCPSCGAKVVEQ